MKELINYLVNKDKLFVLWKLWKSLRYPLKLVFYQVFSINFFLLFYRKMQKYLLENAQKKQNLMFAAIGGCGLKVVFTSKATKQTCSNI